MQSAAFMARQRALHDQIGGLHQIAQFEQIGRDMEIAVILADFLVQQTNPVLRALQAFGGAHDAHIVPHEAAQLVPVVRDDHQFIRIAHPAVVPVRQHLQRGGIALQDVIGSNLGEDQTFEQ